MTETLDSLLPRFPEVYLHKFLITGFNKKGAKLQMTVKKHKFHPNRLVEILTRWRVQVSEYRRITKYYASIYGPLPLGGDYSITLDTNSLNELSIKLNVSKHKEDIHERANPLFHAIDDYIVENR